MINTGFTGKPKSHIMISTAFRFGRSQCCCIQSCFCTASGDDLLFSCVRFQKVSSRDARRPRLTISPFLSPAQSESEKTVTSELMSPNSRHLAPLSLSISSTERVASICQSCVANDLTVFNATRYTANVVSALSWLRNKHLATSGLYLLLCSESFRTSDSHLSQSQMLESRTVFPFSSSRLSTRTSTRVEDHVDTPSLSLTNVFSDSAPRYSLSEPAPMKFALVGCALSNSFFSSNILPFDPGTTKSVSSVSNQRFSFCCCETGFLNCAPTRNPQF